MRKGTGFSAGQKASLKRIWIDCGGEKELLDDFTQELNYFLATSPKLITNGNVKFETIERDNYRKVANACEKLISALGAIDSLDRLNVLSLRERKPEYGDRSLPMCDPLDYVNVVRETASYYANSLGRLRKYERQLNGLEHFLKRFPATREILNSQLIDIACTLWPEVNSESFHKAHKALKKK